MNTYIINEPLHAIGTVKSHLIRKMLYAQGTLMVTYSCGRTIDYVNVLGPDTQYKMFYVRRYGKEIRIFSANRCRAENRCQLCHWPEEQGFQLVGHGRVEVTCEEDSEMELFVKLFDHQRLIKLGAGRYATAKRGH